MNACLHVVDVVEMELVADATEAEQLHIRAGIVLGMNQVQFLANCIIFTNVAVMALEKNFILALGVKVAQFVQDVKEVALSATRLQLII